jgi:GAF domain-containing protein
VSEAGWPDRESCGGGLAALDLLTTVTSAGLNLPTILDTALQSSAELLALPTGFILLWDEEQRGLRLAAVYAKSQEAMPPGRLIPEAHLARWLSGRAFVEQAPIFLPDLRAEPAYADTREARLGAVAAAAVPLTAHEQRLGVLLLASPNRRFFLPAHQRILMTISRQVAVAIDNARLYEDAMRRAERMRLVVDIGQRLNAILDLEPLQEAIVLEVKAALGCQLVALALLHGDELRVGAAASDRGLAPTPKDMVMSADAGLCGWVVRHKEPVCVPDVMADVRYFQPESIRRMEIRSAAVVPMQLGTELLGVLDAESARPDAFDSQDLALLQTVANQAAVAISNARTYAQSEQQARTLRALLGTTQELNSILDLRQLLELIAEQARALIDVDSCVITLLNPETGVLTPVIALHDWADQVLGVTLKLGEGITGQVAQTGVGEVVNHAEQDSRALTVPGTPVLPEALLASPLRCKGRVIGVMTLSRLGERLFSEADLELLDSFASQAAVAVENARLYTESRRRARELEQAHGRLERAQNQLLQAEKLSAIGQLAAGMAHELNNPLTAIMGYAQLLETEDLRSDSRADVRRILAGCARAKKIVANLLTFSHQKRIAPQRVDLPALVERILKLHSFEFETGEAAVRYECAEHLPEAHLDPVQMEQLLVHLLRNAHRATGPEGGQVTVSLSQPGPDLLRLEVTDQGPGIPAETLAHIFDPFFTTTDVGEGQGLGLSACFGIVRAHRGRIWAEPREEGGMRFIVELPLDVEETPEEEAAPDGRSILVVTADEAVAEPLLSAAEEMGHRPSWVDSGEAALAEIVVHRYELVLCDVNLPGMGIGRLYGSVRANDPDLASRFVALGDPGPMLAGAPSIPTPVDPARVREVVAARLQA